MRHSSFVTPEYGVAAGSPSGLAHAVFLLLVSLPLTGCFLHKPKVAAAPPPPPVVSTPVVSIPPPTHPTEPEPVPEVVEAPVVVVPPPPPPRRISRRRPSPPVVITPPVTTAAVAPPVELGQLTTGGESTNAALRQGTEDLLRSQQRRIIALPSATAAAHGEQVDRARLFLHDADEAWKSLDVEGARNLATKAKVILDEITQ